MSGPVIRDSPEGGVGGLRSEPTDERVTTAAPASCRRPAQTSERVLFLTVCRRGVRVGRRLAAGQNARRRWRPAPLMTSVSNKLSNDDLRLWIVDAKAIDREDFRDAHPNMKNYVVPKDDVHTLAA